MQMMRDILQHLAEFKYYFFQYIPSEAIKLLKNIHPNEMFNETEIAEASKSLDPMRRQFDETIANVSRTLGFDIPILMHKSSKVNVTGKNVNR